MSDWKRSTRELSFEQLPAELQAEIQKHIERYNLGDILSELIMCVETHSEKAKKGLFSSAASVHQYAILTPRWLLWAVHDGKSPTPLSALLNDIVVQNYAETPFAKMVPDSGIQVNGKFTDVSENASAFIGLEDNTAGMKFKTMAVQAVQDVKR